jgi:hypothetical protein
MSLTRVVASGMSFLLFLVAALSAPAQPTGSADTDLWTAVVEQLRGGEFGQDRGELVLYNRTLPTSAFHTLPESTREISLLTLLRRRNDSTSAVITGVRLPTNTRLVSSYFGSVNWQEFSEKFPAGTLLRLSLPAFSEDGARAIVVYSASGGFDNSRGAYMIFEKKEGKWIVVDYLGMWIT